MSGTTATIDAIKRGGRLWGRRTRAGKMRSFMLIAMLGVAIGLTSLAYTVSESLKKPLPVRDPQNLYNVALRGFAYPKSALVSLLEFEQIASKLDASVDGVAAFAWRPVGLLAKDGPAETMSAELVTAGYFDVLETDPLIGYLGPPGAATVVIGSRQAQRMFGSPLNALGKLLVVDGEQRRITGVAPVGFRGVWAPKAVPVDVWIPVASGVPEGAAGARFEDVRYQMRLRVSGPRVSEVLAATVDAAYLEATGARTDPGREVFLVRASGVGVHPSLERITSGVTVTCGIGALLLLLIAATNAAVVISTELFDRRAESAIRLALGGSRWLVAVETVVSQGPMWFLVGATGFAVAAGGGHLLEQFRTIGKGGVPFELGVSADLWSAAIGVSVATVVAWAIVVCATLAAVLRGAAGALGRHDNGPRGLTGALEGILFFQVGLACVFVTASGILLNRAVASMPEQLSVRLNEAYSVTISVRPDAVPVTSASVSRLVQELRVLPGFGPVGLADSMPFGAMVRSVVVNVSGRAVSWQTRAVTEGYLGAMGIRLREGREFMAADRTAAAKVVMIDETAAAALTANGSALGQRVRFGSPPAVAEVIGVVARDEALGWDSPVPTMFVPFQPHAGESIVAVARRSGAQAPTSAAVQAAVGRSIPNASTGPVTTLRQRWLAGPAREARAAALAAVGIAAAALAVTLWGLALLADYTVARRRTEIGVRFALGATRWQVMNGLGRRTALVCASGATSGTILSLWAVHVLASLSPQPIGSDLNTYLMAFSGVVTACGAIWCVSFFATTRMGPSELLRVSQ